MQSYAAFTRRHRHPTGFQVTNRADVLTVDRCETLLHRKRQHHHHQSPADDRRSSSSTQDTVYEDQTRFLLLFILSAQPLRWHSSDRYGAIIKPHLRTLFESVPVCGSCLSYSKCHFAITFASYCQR